MATGPGTGTKKKKVKKNIQAGIAHIQATFNNTIITITDPEGNVITWSSAGTQGFKGSRKSTPFAAQMAAQDALRQAMDQGMRTAEVRIKGPGVGREAARGPRPGRARGAVPERATGPTRVRVGPAARGAAAKGRHGRARRWFGNGSALANGPSAICRDASR